MIWRGARERAQLKEKREEEGVCVEGMGGEDEGSNAHSSELRSNSPMTGSLGTDTLLSSKIFEYPPPLLFQNTSETNPKHTHRLRYRSTVMGKQRCLLVDIV